MAVRSCRRLVAALTAALFVLSAVAHHVAAARLTAAAAAGMQAQAAEMGSADTDMPCPLSSDCSPDLAVKAMMCAANCATMVGILAEPIIVPVSGPGHRIAAAMVHTLLSLHGPPDPPPPKSQV